MKNTNIRKILIAATAALLVMAFPSQASAEEPYQTKVLGAPMSGPGFDWDGQTLTLNNYTGGPFAISGNLTVRVYGENEITGYCDTCLGCKKDLLVEGMDGGSLSLAAYADSGISCHGNAIFRNLNLFINAEDLEDGEMTGIDLYNSETGRSGTLTFKNTAGTIRAEKQPGYAVDFLTGKIILEDTETDKQIGHLKDDDGSDSYSFVRGSRTEFSDFDEYMASVASAVTFTARNLPKARHKKVIIPGQKLDLLDIGFPKDITPAFFTVSQKKKASVKKNILKAKRPGNITVTLHGTDDETEDENIVIINKPKLRFPQASMTGCVSMNANDCFTTPDTALTAPDSWQSTNPGVAEVDDAGRITLKSPGKTKIRAVFGNKTVQGRLTVTK